MLVILRPAVIQFLLAGVQLRLGVRQLLCALGDGLGGGLQLLACGFQHGGVFVQQRFGLVQLGAHGGQALVAEEGDGFRLIGGGAALDHGGYAGLHALLRGVEQLELVQLRDAGAGFVDDRYNKLLGDGDHHRVFDVQLHAHLGGGRLQGLQPQRVGLLIRRLQRCDLFLRGELGRFGFLRRVRVRLPFRGLRFVRCLWGIASLRQRGGAQQGRCSGLLRGALRRSGFRRGGLRGGRLGLRMVCPRGDIRLRCCKWRFARLCCGRVLFVFFAVLLLLLALGFLPGFKGGRLGVVQRGQLLHLFQLGDGLVAEQVPRGALAGGLPAGHNSRDAGLHAVVRLVQLFQLGVLFLARLVLGQAVVIFFFARLILGQAGLVLLFTGLKLGDAVLILLHAVVVLLLRGLQLGIAVGQQPFAVGQLGHAVLILGLGVQQLLPTVL